MESINKDTQIFAYISELIIDSEFVQMQHAFYEKHAEIFNDVEENKLEYTTIFEEY